MNFYDFFIFIVRFALANVIELYHVQQPEVATFSTETALHFVYNLKSIRNVASKILTTEAFTTENLRSISEDNRNAFSNVKQILEEESFRRLLVILSKAYELSCTDTDTCIGIGRIRIRGYGNFLKNPIRGYIYYLKNK